MKGNYVNYFKMKNFQFQKTVKKMLAPYFPNIELFTNNMGNSNGDDPNNTVTFSRMSRIRRSFNRRYRKNLFK